jgi:surface antigen
MRFPRGVSIAISTALAAILSFGVLAPSEAANTTICSSWRWTCDGRLGYNPRQSYWRQLTGHNCTNYVAFRLIRDGWSKKLGPFQGNAKVWDNYFRAKGYTVNHQPAVGAIAQWNAHENGLYGSSGHVAYVDVVTADYIIIDEDGWGSKNIRRKIFKGDRHWPGRFIHPKKK